jgi:uncharacterized protein YkuJ
MSDKEILFEKLDDILRRTSECSFMLDDLGKYVQIIIDLRKNGYSGECYVFDTKEIQYLRNIKIYKSCSKKIYVSKYNNKNKVYYFLYNDKIEEVRKNFKKIKKIARNIEMTAIEVYDMLLNLNILNPSKKYSKLSIYFSRDTSNYKEILEEIKNSSIFGRPVSGEVKSKVKSKNQPSKDKSKDKPKDQPVYVYMAIGRDLSYPEGYTFSFWVYIRK